MRENELEHLDRRLGAVKALSEVGDQDGSGASRVAGTATGTVRRECYSETLSRNSSAAAPIRLSLLISATVRSGWATYQPSALIWWLAR